MGDFKKTLLSGDERQRIAGFFDRKANASKTQFSFHDGTRHIQCFREKPNEAVLTVLISESGIPIALREFDYVDYWN